MKREKLIIISNQGLHPIEKKVRKYFEKQNQGNSIFFETITVGNTPLSENFASIVAKKVREVIIRHEDKDVYIVWAGMPIYNAVIYNVAKSLNKSAKFLVYDKDILGYKEFNIDVRHLIFDYK